MTTVISKDGTHIAYEQAGAGPALILIGGGLDDGAENGGLARMLARHFTVFNYARRGRGSSGDAQPYAVEREIEDLDALIAEAGGRTHVFGASSGGALALEAAAAGSDIARVAVYEVPYDPADGVAEQQEEYVRRLDALLAEDRRGDALALFMTYAGSSEADIAEAKRSPLWPGLEAIAHTLAYDAACLRDRTPPVAMLARVRQPVLVATGDPSWFEAGAEAVTAALPDATRLRLGGQSHVPEPAVLGPALVEFFSRRA